MNSSSIKNVQDELSRYKKLTLQSHQLIQSLINLVSQKTTINNDQNQKMIGDALNISTVFDATNEEYLELKDSINVVRIALRSSLKKIVDMSMDLPNDSGYFDLAYFRTVMDNMKQQALLQENIFACIEDLNNQNYDQDAMVTLLACCRYSPYFDVNVLDNLILTK